MSGCSQDDGESSGNGDTADDGSNGDTGGDSDGGTGNGDDGVDPASVCAEPSADALEDMLPPSDPNSDELGKFSYQGDGKGSGVLEYTGGSDSTSSDYDYHNNQYGVDGGTYYAFILEFTDGSPPGVTPAELFTVGFGDGDFEDDHKLVYALVGDHLYIAGGPEEAVSRDLLTKYPALSRECADAATLADGTATA